MTITCSTKVCSFGKQVVEKVETEYARFENGRFVYRIQRSPMCEYMINFIHKLKHLPEKYMMNSVLENFTILQVSSIYSFHYANFDNRFAKLFLILWKLKTSLTFVGTRFSKTLIFLIKLLQDYCFYFFFLGRNKSWYSRNIIMYSVCFWSFYFRTWSPTSYL